MEERAHASHTGIWQGEFTQPMDWRRQQRAASALANISGPTMPAAASAGRAAAAPASSSAAAPAAAPAGGAATWAAVVAGNAPAAAAAPAARSNAAVAGAPPPPAQQCAASSAAVIKGNINAKCERIYHTPRDSTYSLVKIDAAAGERYFCSEEEARAAGWRPVLR